MKTKRILLSLLLSAVSLKSYALPIVDWDAFAAGDRKAVAEVSTGLIWMDFGITVNQSYNTTVGQLNTVYQGWRLPTQGEVTHLWNGMKKGTNFPPDGMGYTSGTYWSIFDIFGINHSDWGHLQFESNGLFLNNNNYLSTATVFQSLYSGPQDNQHYIYMDISHPSYAHPFDRASQYSSTLLVKIERAKVPESSGFLLIMLGLAGLGLRRTNQIRKYSEKA